MVSTWGSCRAGMEWCGWIYQCRHARWFTPGQAPLLWRTACSAEPARWVWCQTWVQCCSTCPAIPPGPQNEREDTEITLWHFQGTAQGRCEDKWETERVIKSNYSFEWEDLNGAPVLHVRFWDVTQIKAVRCSPGKKFPRGGITTGRNKNWHECQQQFCDTVWNMHVTTSITRGCHTHIQVSVSKYR